jgi:hypothetical protein
VNWEAIGAVSDVLGAIAVVVTLLYLAKQIIQTNQVAKAAVARELQDKYTDFYALVATNSEIQELVTSLRDPNYVAQSPKEEEQIEGFCLLLLGIWLTTGVAYEQGQIDIKQYGVYKDDINVKLVKKWPGLLPHAKRILKNYPDTASFEIFKDIQD